jgi:hypothetical protein
LLHCDNVSLDLFNVVHNLQMNSKRNAAHARSMC